MTQGNNEAIMGRLHIMAQPHITNEQNERSVLEWKSTTPQDLIPIIPIIALLIKQILRMNTMYKLLL